MTEIIIFIFKLKKQFERRGTKDSKLLLPKHQQMKELLFKVTHFK